MLTTLSELHGSFPSIKKKSFGQTALLWIGTAAYFQMVVYLYVNVVVGSRAYDQVGVMAMTPSLMDIFASAILALIPLFVLPRRLDRPSTVVLVYLYYMVFVPSCAIIPYASYRSIDGWFGFLFVMMLMNIITIVIRPNWTSFVSGFAVKHLDTYIFLIMGLCILFSFVLIFYGEIDFKGLDLLDVYEKRMNLIESQSLRVIILFYLANMAGYALSPIALVLGLRYRNYLLIIAAIITSFLAFAFTSYKSELIVPVMTAIVYIISRHDKRLGFTALFLILLIGIAITSIMWDMRSDNPIFTWTIHFRLVGNNGFLSAKYADFFAVNPPGLFADSVGRLFNSPAYDRPISQVVGESFSSVSGNHANANIWADGYGNLGFLGMGLATLELMLLLQIFDALANNERMILIAPMAIPAAFSMSNTAVHSSITSNGLILSFLLIALMPRTLPPRVGL